MVQDYVSGRVCCVNQYHYESRQRRVVMRLYLVHATGKTWYKVLYQHTVYVISLSNISIKTNFKQILRVELKFVNTLRETTFCVWRNVIFPFIRQCHVTVFCLTFHDMISWQSSSAENVSCNVTPFFYHHSVVIQHFVSDTVSLYQTGDFRKFQRKTYLMLDKSLYRPVNKYFSFILRLIKFTICFLRNWEKFEDTNRSNHNSTDNPMAERIKVIRSHNSTDNPMAERIGVIIIRQTIQWPKE